MSSPSFDIDFAPFAFLFLLMNKCVVVTHHLNTENYCCAYIYFILNLLSFTWKKTTTEKRHIGNNGTYNKIFVISLKTVPYLLLFKI